MIQAPSESQGSESQEFFDDEIEGLVHAIMWAKEYNRCRRLMQSNRTALIEEIREEQAGLKMWHHYAKGCLKLKKPAPGAQGRMAFARAIMLEEMEFHPVVRALGHQGCARLCDLLQSKEEGRDSKYLWDELVKTNPSLAFSSDKKLVEDFLQSDNATLLAISTEVSGKYPGAQEGAVRDAHFFVIYDMAREGKGKVPELGIQIPAYLVQEAQKPRVTPKLGIPAKFLLAALAGFIANQGCGPLSEWVHHALSASAQQADQPSLNFTPPSYIPPALRAAQSPQALPPQGPSK